MHTDLIIKTSGQLLTCASGGLPKRGRAHGDPGIIRSGAVAVIAGKIVAVGTFASISEQFDADELIDAEGRVVCPAFVDPHTHIVFAGDRLNEFELKIKGADYLEILASGGGIISTVEHTRSASFDTLVELAMERLDKMLAHGTTTAEIKTGYGLDLETEIRMLTVIEELDTRHAIDIVPTFLPAHAVPPEYKDDAAAYVDLVCDEMLPRAWEWYLDSRFRSRGVPFFADVFCENGAFDVVGSKRVLATAKEIGFAVKAHVDEFTNLGGSRMSLQQNAVSIDHLDAISDAEVAELAASNTVGVVTPTVNFNLGSSKFADARKFIDAGCAVALSTDYNPGSAPCPSMPMAMAIACRYQKLQPAEAFNAATINAAFAIGQGSVAGSIEPGKQADILILETDDYRQTAYEFGGNLVSRVFKSGRHVI